MFHFYTLPNNITIYYDTILIRAKSKINVTNSLQR